MQKNSWQLKDIIMIGIVSIIFGIIYLGAVNLGIFLGAFLTPFGLSLFANEIIFGVWFMAASFAGYVLQKPGVSTVTEMIAALLEVFMGSVYGPLVFISGFLQGIGYDLGFGIFRFRRFGWVSLTLGAIFATITSFIWGLVRSSFGDIQWQILLLIFVVRLLSALFFSVVVVKLTCDRLAKSGVLGSYPLGSAASHHAS
ncbi:ECF transporter S component [Latilactobacillus sakei]|uniref:ECF transporter S component n=1 Tax=Latilactobacillus sakei TaxID=1599 RepID=UPI00388B4C08